MAMNIKDLCGNSGHRFKKINNNNKKKHFTSITWFLLACCVVLVQGKEITLIAADQY